MTESLRLRWAGDGRSRAEFRESLASSPTAWALVISATRFTRMFLQSLVLGLGVWIL